MVDRKTRCILGWVVVWERTQQAIQLMVDDAPKSKWYFSDGFDAYARLWYHYGRYEVSQGKTIPIRLKVIMQNCVTIWLVLRVSHAVFRAVLTLYSVL